MKANKILWRIIGLTTITVVGLIIIPPLMKQYGNKLYKKSIEYDKFDFDNLGPEIVRKEN